jgi:hypothetical protein
LRRRNLRLFFLYFLNYRLRLRLLFLFRFFLLLFDFWLLFLFLCLFSPNNCILSVLWWLFILTYIHWHCCWLPWSYLSFFSSFISFLKNLLWCYIILSFLLFFYSLCYLFRKRLFKSISNFSWFPCWFLSSLYSSINFILFINFLSFRSRLFY